MFKPGDKVFVRHHTQDEKEIYPLVWSSTMDQSEGNFVTVIDVISLLTGTYYEVDDGCDLTYFVASSLMAIEYEQF